MQPQNLDAEQMVLGAVLTENDAIDKIIDIIVPEDFYKDAHRTIYTTMLAMHDSRDAIDLITLPDKLLMAGALEKVGGAFYLAQLASLAPTAANIQHHARIVREKAVYRRGIHAAQEIIGAGYEEKLPSEDFLDLAERKIF